LYNFIFYLHFCNPKTSQIRAFDRNKDQYLGELTNIPIIIIITNIITDVILLPIRMIFTALALIPAITRILVTTVSIVINNRIKNNIRRNRNDTLNHLNFPSEFRENSRRKNNICYLVFTLFVIFPNFMIGHTIFPACNDIYKFFGIFSGVNPDMGRS